MYNFILIFQAHHCNSDAVNALYCPKLATHVVRICRHAPMWSSFSGLCQSNAPAESWFSTVKGPILGGERLLHPAEFIHRTASFVDRDMVRLETDKPKMKPVVTQERFEEEDAVENWKGKGKEKRRRKRSRK